MKKNEARVKVGIKLTENMIYKCDLGQINMDDLFIDETRKKRTDRIGPSPTKLLALSVLGCLAACFEFCLQKKGVTLSDLDGRAEVTFARNEKNFWRIKKINVEFLPKIDNPEMRKSVAQCKRLFEQYCIITESLRKGIEIDVKLECLFFL